MDCGDCVFCLVVADQTGVVTLGHHQGYNLACSLHKRLAAAGEGETTGWVNILDHGTSLSIEDKAIVLVPVAVTTQDDDVLGIYLREDGVDPRG